MPRTVSLTTYVGIPYLRNGRDDLTGLDCWGLVRAVYARELAISLPAYGDADAGSLLSAARKVAGVASGHPWLPVDAPQDMDVVLMRHSMHSRFPGHVGLWWRGRVLHSIGGTNSALVRADHHSVAWRILGFRRHVAVGPRHLS